jgi:hypothetical protein
MKRLTRPCYLVALAVAYVLLWGFTPVAEGQVVNDPRPAVLVYAETGQWHSELIVSAAAPSSTEYSNCPLGPAPVVTLPENGVARVRDFGRSQCGASIGFVRVALRYGTDAKVDMTFSDGVTKSHFAVPALEVGIPHGERRAIRRVISDAQNGTFLVLVNAGTTPTSATLIVLNGRGDEVLGTEIVDLPVGVTAYTLQTSVEIGTVLITNGVLIGTPAQQNSVIYGFAAIGPFDGGSQRIEEIE